MIFKVWRLLIIICFVACLVWALSATKTNSSVSEKEREEVRASFDRVISEFQGEPYVIHFWATWCEPCVKELPELLAFIRSKENRGFRLLLVSEDESKEEMQSFLNRLVVPKDVFTLLDHRGVLMGDQRVGYLPQSLIYNEYSEKLENAVGPQRWQHPSFVEDLNALMGSGESR